MKKSRITREIVVGTVFMAVLILLAILTFVIDEDGYRLTDPYDRQYRCRFAAQVELEAGGTVRQCGMVAGRIDGTRMIKVGDRYEVEVLFSMKDPFIVREDSYARLEARSLLMGAELAVDPGSPDSPALAPGSLVSTRAGTRLTDTVVALNDVLDGLPDGGLGRMLVGDKGFGEVDTILDTLASDGGMGKWIVGTENHRRVASMTGDLRAAAVNLRRGTSGTSVVSRLLGDDELGGVVDEAVVDLRAGAGGVRRLGEDAVKGKSVLSRLAADEGLGEKTDGIITDLAGVTRDLHTSRSALARLIRDGDLGDQLARALEGVEQFAVKLVSNENTIMKLIESPELYDDLVHVVRQAAEAIEDTREAYPINVMSTLVQQGAASVVTGGGQ